MLKDLYFCEMCRSLIKEVGLIHFVEEHSDRGFCSEECIKNFYRPYMNSLEIEEKGFREELKLTTEEDYIEIVGNEHYLNLALEKPTEKWQTENDLGQRFLTHILDIKTEKGVVYFILICSYIDNEPSFVFYRTATSSDELKVKYQRESRYESSSHDVDDAESAMLGDEYEIPSDVIETLEFKKSQILAQMMENRSAGDIQFEEFTAYDKYLEQTIENPDEIYEYEDEEGDILNNFIKSFKLGDLSFFYVVILLPYKLEKVQEQAVLPIMGFPSIDNNLYPKYAIGKNLNEKLKN